MAELRSRAKTRTGRRYDNGYAMLFTVEEGKVSRIREYTDLIHAIEVFGS